MPAIWGRRKSLLTLIGTGFGLSGVTSSVLGQGKMSTATYPVASTGYATMMVASVKGFFKDEGLDVKLIHGGSGSKSREILAAGQAEFAIGDVTHSLLLSNRNRPSRVIYSVDRRSGGAYYLIRKDLYDAGVTTLEKAAAWQRPDGRKTLFGVSSLGGTSHVWASFITEQLGIGSRFTFLGVGNVDTMMGSIRSKQIDLLGSSAAMVADAERNGWAKLIFSGADKAVWDRIVGGDVPVTGHFVLQASIDKDPAKIQAYVNAVHRANVWVARSSAEAVQDAIESFVGSTSRESNLIEINAARELINPDGIATEESFKRGEKVWFRESTGVKPLPFNEAFNNDFARLAKSKLK